MKNGSYLLNCWYGFGWSEELESGPLISRRILDMPLVAFRDTEGAVKILADRCSHRFAPLSMGKVEGGRLRCHYHGLAYDGSGRCVASPYGDPPTDARVRAFPAVERDGLIWVWPGAPEAVNPDLIPDYDFHHVRDDRDWVIKGYTHVATNYENETDNLMDLTHAEYLHAQTFRLGGAALRAKLQIHDDGAEIRANLWMPDEPSPAAPGGFGIDRFLDMRWLAPSNMRLKVGFLEAGEHVHRSEDIRDDLPGQFSAHIITPETATTCHYFWSANQPRGAGPFAEPQSQEAGMELFKIAFEIEDKPMLEAVQSNMTQDFWSERPVIMRSDAGGIRCRRRLAKMIRGENVASSVVEPAAEGIAA